MTSEHEGGVFLTTTQVANMLTMSERTIEKWRYKGTPDNCVELPYQKFGQTVRYRRSDVLEFIQAQTRTSTSDTKSSNNQNTNSPNQVTTEPRTLTIEKARPVLEHPTGPIGTPAGPTMVGTQRSTPWWWRQQLRVADPSQQSNEGSHAVRK